MFGVKYIRNELYIPNRSKGITYIKNLLKDEFDIINKNIKVDGKVTNGFKGLKLKSNVQHAQPKIELSDNTLNSIFEYNNSDSLFKEIGVECDAAHRFDNGVEY